VVPQKINLVFAKVFVNVIIAIVSLPKYQSTTVFFYLVISLCSIKLKINRMAYRYTFLKPYLELHLYI